MQRCVAVEACEDALQTFWTIGHSTRTATEFRELLIAHDIQLLVDVRRFPGSRRLPQFGRDALREHLTTAGIDYCWMSSLGGRRKPDPDSVNVGWRHPAFRAYADYMSSEEFAAGLFELLMLAEGARTAIMCSEVLWWRCHRRLISDAGVSLGYRVMHVRDARVVEEHRLAPPADLEDGTLSYITTI